MLDFGSSRFSVISPRPNTVQAACLREASATHSVVIVCLWMVLQAPGEGGCNFPAGGNLLA